MTIYKLESLMNFGKYEGRTVKKIACQDPDYLAWAIDEIEGFELDEKAEEEMEEALGYMAMDDCLVDSGEHPIW